MSKEAFLESMRALLGEGYAPFAKSLEEAPFRGIYVNTLKCNVPSFRRLFPYALRPTPFSENGFYIDNAVSGLGNHPLHHAGAFYVQEPSAMSAAAALFVQAGEKVLDLCAAPGGKTTALAGTLAGTGLLWSNEFVKSRAFTLLSNCERIGVKDCVISNASPAALAAELPGFFDKVLVDAPCSGEGMLRKEKAAYDDWNEGNIRLCAARQKEILNSAALLLHGGGEMVYSTCTFNRTENEEIIEWFLATHPAFSLLPIPCAFGSPGIGMPQAKRVFPSDGGEGHFVARLKKNEDATDVKFTSFTYTKAPPAFHAFYEPLFSAPPSGNAVAIGTKVYLLPENMPAIKHINVLRAGVFAGEMKGNRFLPAHALFSASTASECNNKVNFSLEDERLARYLHGEEIPLDSPLPGKGYCAVEVEGIPLSFGKVSDGKLKNHYPKGLRNLN